MNGQRLIDVTIHEINSTQALEQLLRYFRESTKEPIVLMAKRGEGVEMLDKIRASLSAIRRTYRENGQVVPHFGFRSTGPFNIYEDGITKECHAITYRITPLQQMKNLAQREELT